MLDRRSGMTRKRQTKLERDIEEVGRRPLSDPKALENLLLLECLEDIQKEREAKKAAKEKAR